MKQKEYENRELRMKEKLRVWYETYVVRSTKPECGVQRRHSSTKSSSSPFVPLVHYSKWTRVSGMRHRQSIAVCLPGMGWNACRSECWRSLACNVRDTYSVRVYNVYTVVVSSEIDLCVCSFDRIFRWNIEKVNRGIFMGMASLLRWFHEVQ